MFSTTLEKGDGCGATWMFELQEGNSVLGATKPRFMTNLSRLVPEMNALIGVCACPAVAF